MNYDIEKLVSEINFEENKLVDCGKIALTNKEIEVLKRYDINYKKCISLKEVLFYIEDILEEENFEDLEEISLSISERDYYKNSNK